MIERVRIDDGWPWALFGARRGTGVPGRLADLNNVVAPYEAAFSHAWQLGEASGNALDMAPSGAIPLVPGASPPTRGVVTGLVNGDKAVQFTSPSGESMECALGTSLDVTTGSVILYLKGRLHAVPGASYGIAGKGQVNYWITLATVAGHIQFFCSDGAITPALTITVDHVGTAYFDMLAVADRDSASKLMSFNSNLGDAGTTSIAALGTLTGTNPFCLGQIAGIASAGPMITTFAAWGTVPGALVANRVAALARLRKGLWG